MPAKITSMRLSDEEVGFFEEVADRLKITQSEAMRLALHALKERMGLLEEDTVDFQERVARMWGDDAVLKFEITSLEPPTVEATVSGDPIPQFEAHAVIALADQPTDALIVAKDVRRGSWYSVGHAKLERGSTVDVPLRRMPDLLQSRADDERTPEERRTAARMNSLLRRLSRESRGEPDDD